MRSNNRYHHPWEVEEKTLWQLAKYWLTSTQAMLPDRLDEHFPVRAPVFERTSDLRAVWLGHATFYVDLGGFAVLTDPVFEHPIGPWFWRMRRFRPAPCAIAALPRVDAVCISHNHFDHLNPSDVRDLARAQPHLEWLVPAGTEAEMARAGVPPERVHACQWWESVEVGGARATFVPAQHWSGRGLLDRNASLWGGWVWEHDGLCAYHAGDTGYCGVFAEIGARFAVDLAMLPIGACEPREFMAGHHADAHDAARIHRDVGARLSVAMHHGTFRLSSAEHALAPRETLDSLGIDNFRWVHHGEAVELARNK
jgi:N-acyl-phosphatidylethanolamine-hydrolysing phospholipase D